MLEFCVLASGSAANCIYLGNDSARVLIDCGLSAKRAADRLQERGIDPDSIDAIVISHEHNDHVKGVRVFAKRHSTNVFLNERTLASSEDLQAVPVHSIVEFDSQSRFSIGELEFEPFPVLHDAADPVGFRITSGSSSLGVVTDLGQVTSLVKEQMRSVDAIILESNHDPELLEGAPYPWELKQRIGSRSGHLSNEKAGALLEELENPKVVVAAHISENSNDPKLVLEVFRNSWGGRDRQPQFVAASVHAATELYKI